jgi:hypothetical protein
MKGLFEIAGGSIIGKKHLKTYQNNQDAYDSISNELATIAVVCDGCSSGKHSEVGAKLGAKLFTQAIGHHISSESINFDAAFWEEISLEVVTQLQDIAEKLTGNNPLKITVNDYFLFTIVGAIITPLETVIFSIGDGIVAINNEIKFIGEKYQNTPHYFGYHLCGYPQWSTLEIQYQLPTKKVESILIGTDGVKDLINAENKLLPRKKQLVENLAQFWLKDAYFDNQDSIRRYLYLMNQDFSKPDWNKQQINKQVGLLPDDTTLIVIRKKLINN